MAETTSGIINEIVAELDTIRPDFVRLAQKRFAMGEQIDLFNIELDDLSPLRNGTDTEVATLATQIHSHLYRLYDHLRRYTAAPAKKTTANVLELFLDHAFREFATDYSAKLAESEQYIQFQDQWAALSREYMTRNGPQLFEQSLEALQDHRLTAVRTFADQFVQYFGTIQAQVFASFREEEANIILNRVWGDFHSETVDLYYRDHFADLYANLATAWGNKLLEYQQQRPPQDLRDLPWTTLLNHSDESVRSIARPLHNLCIGYFGPEDSLRMRSIFFGAPGRNLYAIPGQDCIADSEAEAVFGLMLSELHSLTPSINQQKTHDEWAELAEANRHGVLFHEGYKKVFDFVVPVNSHRHLAIEVHDNYGNQPGQTLQDDIAEKIARYRDNYLNSSSDIIQVVAGRTIKYGEPNDARGTDLINQLLIQDVPGEEDMKVAELLFDPSRLSTAPRIHAPELMEWMAEHWNLLEAWHAYHTGNTYDEADLESLYGATTELIIEWLNDTGPDAWEYAEQSATIMIDRWGETGLLGLLNQEYNQESLIQWAEQESAVIRKEWYPTWRAESKAILQEWARECRDEVRHLNDRIFLDMRTLSDEWLATSELPVHPLDVEGHLGHISTILEQNPNHLRQIPF